MTIGDLIHAVAWSTAILIVAFVDGDLFRDLIRHGSVRAGYHVHCKPVFTDVSSDCGEIDEGFETYVYPSPTSGISMKVLFTT